jgi:rubrerythrin
MRQRSITVSEQAETLEPTANLADPSGETVASRGHLLRRLVLAGGGLGLGGAALGGAWLAGAAAAPAKSAAPSKAQDARILNFALLLEYTEEAFYTEALQRAGLKGDLLQYAQVAAKQERDHRLLLQKVLGAQAAKRPSFAFGAKTRSAKAFTAAAIELEDLAVSAYNGQAANLTRDSLAAAATIVSVEARHAAWIRAISGLVAAPDAVDKPVTAVEAARGLKQIGLRT